LASLPPPHGWEEEEEEEEECTIAAMLLLSLRYEMFKLITSPLRILNMHVATRNSSFVSRKTRKEGLTRTPLSPLLIATTIRASLPFCSYI